MKKLPPKNVPGSLVDAEGPGDEVYFRGQLGTTFKLGRVTQQNVGCCEVHVVRIIANGHRTKKEEQGEVKEEYRAGKVWSK